MTKTEHPVFLTGFGDDRGGLPYIFFNSGKNFLFPKVDIENTYPEIILVVETIESFFEDLTVYLVADVTTPDSGELETRCDELIIATQRSETTGEETFYYVITPLGTFYFDFFQILPNGKLIETEPILITPEIKENLFLAPCEIAFDQTNTHIVYEYPVGMPIPPLPPEKYLDGSLHQKHAAKYYEFRENDETVIEISFITDKGNDPPPSNVPIDNRVLAGDSYRYGWDWDDEYSDNHEEEDEDEDDDDEDEEGEVFYQYECFQTIHYVIRPEG